MRALTKRFAPLFSRPRFSGVIRVSSPNSMTDKMIPDASDAPGIDFPTRAVQLTRRCEPVSVIYDVLAQKISVAGVATIYELCLVALSYRQFDTVSLSLSRKEPRSAAIKRT